MKFKDGVLEWGPWTYKGETEYHYYLALLPNWLRKENRYLGYEAMPYDHQLHESWGFWFFNISWCVRLR